MLVSSIFSGEKSKARIRGNINKFIRLNGRMGFWESQESGKMLFPSFQDDINGPTSIAARKEIIIRRNGYGGFSEIRKFSDWNGMEISVPQKILYVFVQVR